MEQSRPGTSLLNDPVEWGRLLISTHDHDPLYTGLTNWDVRGSRVRRFMLAYWCCYSVGASWWLSQHSGQRFYEYLVIAAHNQKPSPLGERWPRAHERRHWRGDKSVKSALWLAEHFKHPEEAVISLEAASSLGEVNKLMNWPQFGPWIAFKAADMLERVLGSDIGFPEEVITLYKDPREGAEMAATVMDPQDEAGYGPQDVVSTMLFAYSGLVAPGQQVHSRGCNIQEVETVLCKWKSARKGNYWIGLDTRDHRAELEKWGAQDLLAAYPTPGA